jgi:hypothetical protein
MSDAELLQLVDALERDEAALLAWGYVDGGFTEDEILVHIQRTAQVDEDDADDLLQRLIDARLVFRIRQARALLFRTRSAESVRLLANLRQLFPNDLTTGGWRTAPSLVSDFRYSARPRKYPARVLTPSSVVEAIAGDRDDFTKRALHALLARPGEFLLAEFQQEAARQILADLDGNTSRATIVGAGTGSGKTLAFYLPALAHIAARIDTSHWAKGLAVYPRNELLKDQLSETLTEARRLDATLSNAGRRKLLIGAYFGPTPRDGADARRKWKETPQGLTCPYLRCPVCDADLFWHTDDWRAECERLTCSKPGCGAIVSEDEIVLTRASMRRRPPDVLFTTTEMLNRQLADSTNGHIFGVGAPEARRPYLMLLDEVHTYSGTTGAQAAYVLRRWRHAIRRPVQFVGLSATLREAQSFFAQFIGLPDHTVSSVAPSDNHLVSEGAEYLLALRGDPVSGTSLLSTTIQTSMLLRRILDARAGGVYGSRLFTFTDDLDVTNRLYFQLLDAEGRDSWGRFDPRGHGALAALRARTQPEHAARQLLGQAWDVCEDIGHHLDRADGLRIGRTSSQDPGVAAVSDVIVATASLDVGFNDPTVGAVLQHKAPRGAAQFLQRKGRAGRVRGMRPWTVVVLSDYGRDRLAYQGYDLLFDPSLESTSLPLRNTYVIRMQAGFAFMDWLTSRLPKEWKGSTWLDLAGPIEVNQPRQQFAAQRQQMELQLIEGCLTDSSTRQQMLAHVKAALGITNEQLHAIAWEAPRALVLDVLPTLRRRLASNWAVGAEVGQDYNVRWQPMPDFVPSNLFSDLNLPETVVHLPPAQRGAEETEHHLPVLQALRAFAPGRVSLRYGIEHRNVRHWVPIPLDNAEAELDLGAFVGQSAPLGEFAFHHGGVVERVQGIRPFSLRVEAPPRNLANSTNAMLEWRSQFQPTDAGDELHVPSPSAWDDIAPSFQLFMHARQSSVTVSRLAVASDVSLAFDDGRRSDTVVTFTSDGQKAALGFQLAVDAIRVRSRVPRFFDGASAYARDAASVRSFRAAYFVHLIERDRELNSRANVFQLQWLGQIYLSVVLERALRESIGIRTALDAADPEALSSELEQALDVIFQALPTDLDPGDPPGDAPEPHRQRLHQTLAAMLHDPDVVARVSTLARVLWDHPDEAWQRWAADRYANTLAAAIREGADRLCREVGAQNLVLDVDVDHDDGLCTIWISEPSLGGGGIVEEFARRYNDDPRLYFQLVESALAPNDFEIVDGELSRILDLAVGDPEIAERFSTIRAQDGHAATTAAMRRLRAELAMRGLAVTHPVTAALSARVLRPGSSAQTDRALCDLVAQWRAEEARLGVEIDARVFAFAASASDAIDHVVPAVTAGASDPRQRRFATLYGLLWPRGSAVRASGLRSYNPYHLPPPTDRLLVSSALQHTTPIVQLSVPDWLERFGVGLVEHGAVLLAVSADSARLLRSATVEVLGRPLDAGYLMLYPRVVGFERDGTDIRVRFELREAFQ